MSDKRPTLKLQVRSSVSFTTPPIERAPEPDPLRMWACVGWYVLACLALAAFLASWGWT